MKLWVDDIRRPPTKGYLWVKSVNEAKEIIEHSESIRNEIEYSYKGTNAERALHYYWRIVLIDLDHDAGDYVNQGGDYIKLLDWLEATGRNNYTIRIHSMNPVGVENMRRIIRRNNWREV